MIDVQTLEGWHAEIAAELAAARTERDVLEDGLRAAQTTSDAARAQQQSTQLQLNSLREPMAFRLAARVRDLGDGASAAAGEVVNIRNQVMLTREKIADLEQALRQIETLMPAPNTEAVEMQEHAHAG